MGALGQLVVLLKELVQQKGQVVQQNADSNRMMQQALHPGVQVLTHGMSSSMGKCANDGTSREDTAHDEHDDDEEDVLSSQEERDHDFQKTMELLRHREDL